jgi:hypothetical protein
VAGITTLQSGFPILIADTGFRSLTCDSYTFYGCPHAPNQVAPINVSDPRTSEFVNTTRKPSNTTALPSYWFNPNSFALEAIGTIGNAGRNNFAGPGMNNTDLSLSKRVYFGTENQRRFLELRLEAFNARSITHSSRWSPRPMAAAGYPEILTLPNSVEFCRPRLDGPFRSERNSTSEPDPVLKNVLKGSCTLPSLQAPQLQGGAGWAVPALLETQRLHRIESGRLARGPNPKEQTDSHRHNDPRNSRPGRHRNRQRSEHHFADHRNRPTQP